MTGPAVNGLDLLVVGSLNADLVVGAERLPDDGETVAGHTYFQAAGGKGLNQAVACARAGARTAMLGAVGDDDLGAFLRAQASASGVDLDAVVDVPGVPTGVALIMVGDGGMNRIVVVPGANGTVDAASVDARRRPATVCLTQLEVPLDAVAAALTAARAEGAVTILNPAPARELPADLLREVTWLLPNEHEAALLLGASLGEGTAGALAAAHALQELGPAAVAITLGGRGAVAVDPAGVEHVLSAFRVTAVDTTAAGDAFCGTFAAALADGLDPATALRRAAAGGALATTRPGAVPSLPLRSEVDALLATHPAGG